MRRFFFFVLILLSLDLGANEFLTAQIPDRITYEGKEYALNSNPLEPFFDKYPEKRPQFSSTALWRGYIAHFEIIEDQLFVTDIFNYGGYTDSKGNYKTKLVSIFKTIFPNTDKYKIDWYTGILIVPDGKLVEYVHMGYSSTYSKYILLEIENGNFNEARKYKNKEFVSFKKRQFEEFKKTDEYKKLYKELKEQDAYGDDNFIVSFISDYVTNYTSKFLTE